MADFTASELRTIKKNVKKNTEKTVKDYRIIDRCDDLLKLATAK